MLTIRELAGARFRAALDLLEEGHSFEYSHVAFRLDGDAALECAVVSSWMLEHVSNETARHDIARAKDVLGELRQHARFASIVGRRSERFVVLCGCEKSYVAVARYQDERLVWAEGLPTAGR